MNRQMTTTMSSVGDSCQIWSEITNDSHVPKVGSLVYNRIFIKGLPNDATIGDIHNVFGQYGHILEIKMITDRNGRSKGYGFITFDNADEALAVLKNPDTIYIKRKDIIVGPAVRKPSRKLQAMANQYRYNQTLNSISVAAQPVPAPIYLINPISILPPQQYTGYIMPSNAQPIAQSNAIGASTTYMIDTPTAQYGPCGPSITPVSPFHLTSTAPSTPDTIPPMYSHIQHKYPNTIIAPMQTSYPVAPITIENTKVNHHTVNQSTPLSSYYDSFEYRKLSESDRNNSLYSGTTDESPSMVGNSTSFHDEFDHVDIHRRNSLLHSNDNTTQTPTVLKDNTIPLVFGDSSKINTYETPNAYGNQVYATSAPVNFTTNVINSNSTNRYPPTFLYWAIPIAQH